MAKLKIYLGCALGGLTPDHREKMVVFRETLKKDFEVLEFRPAETPPADIYMHDIHFCVKNADLMLAICDHPSTGLGYEMSTMLEKYDKPLLAVAQNGNHVSNLIQGITSELFEFKRYSDIEEVLPMLINFSRKYYPEKN